MCIGCSAGLGKNNLFILLAAHCFQTECHCNLFLQRKKDIIAFCEENTDYIQQLSPPKMEARQSDSPSHQDCRSLNSSVPVE